MMFEYAYQKTIFEIETHRIPLSKIHNIKFAGSLKTSMKARRKSDRDEYGVIAGL